MREGTSAPCATFTSITLSVVFLLILGGLAGWLAATLVRGHGLGVWGNIGVGIVGAVLGATLLDRWACA